MFGKSIQIFKLFGFSVKVDASWLLLAFLITWTLAKGLFPYYYEKEFSSVTYWWMGVAGAVGLFLSIVLHELSHSVVARSFGLPIKGITLFIFGGVAEMDEEPPNAKAELFMALAGPIASIGLAGAFMGLEQLGNVSGWPAYTTAVLDYLAWINLILAAFNLVPAFPLDGGRVFRSILWKWQKNIRKATKTASRVGSGFGMLLIILGVFVFLQGNLIGGIWWFILGMFLRNASRGSHQQLLIRQALSGEKVERFMNEDVVTVSPDASVEDLVENFVYRHHFKLYPVVDEGRLVGCVTTRDVKEVPKEAWSEKRVRDIAQECSDENSIGVDEDAMKALTRMSQKGISRLMVLRDGELAGILSTKDLMQFLRLKMDLEPDEEPTQLPGQ